MFRYFDKFVICNELETTNKKLKEEIEELKIANEIANEIAKEDLQYKYNGLLECKTDIYTKYQDNIIRNSK